MDRDLVKLARVSRSQVFLFWSMLPTMDLLKELSQVKINMEDMFTISSVQYPKYFLI